IQAQADATIAVIDVPIEEASRFGIMNTDETGRIIEFEEKPKAPKSTLASMGIYIFTYEKLRNYLIQDAQDPNSSYDFGKNIIPAMLGNNEKLIAYRFEGYWKDVGTVQSFWEANMDMLHVDNEINLFQSNWKMYTQTASRPSQYIGKNAVIKDSMISEGCVVLGEVNHSVIFPGVTIAENTRVVDSIVFPNCVIQENVIVNKSILLDHVCVRPNNVIGNGEDVVVIEDHKVLESSGLTE
ncbi:MAG: glucose-1-phosphate adenylyltransferase, partial [Clostridia bacterium]|nr:glucose-1-phosphate adenylyltransferase [Clostridia bacterium]